VKLTTNGANDILPAYFTVKNWELLCSRCCRATASYRRACYTFGSSFIDALGEAAWSIGVS
jgi:hypothetical protein